jgi:hypothetical protein
MTEPMKTREQRREGLVHLLVAWEVNRDYRLWDLFHRATGLPEGQQPPRGTLVFQTILDYEFGQAVFSTPA